MSSSIAKCYSLLERLKYNSKNKEERRKFQQTVFKLEDLLHGYTTTPLNYFLQNKKKINKRYLYTRFTKKSYKVVTSGNIIEHGVEVLPLDIRNAPHNVNHLNILLINGNTVTRIDPSFIRKTKLYSSKIDPVLKEYLDKYKLKYTGMSKRNKFINHHRLCRYAAPAIVLHGKRLTHKILKKMILDYFKYHIGVYLVKKKKNKHKKN